MKKIKLLFTLVLCICIFFSNLTIVKGEVSTSAPNTATLFWEQHSSYDDEAEKKRLEIVNSKSIVTTAKDGKTTFYISESGDDANDGRSPETAWKSTANLWNYSWFNYGDVVLFERGGIYRNAHFVMMNGLSYGAYGVGDKPALYGSAYNYANKSFWQETAIQNVWKVELESEITNIGNIVFDFGKFCGNYLRDNNLQNDFDFWEDAENHCLYLYYSKGNPGEQFEDIEICDGRNILSGGPNSNIKVDNLCIRYTGAHGISFNNGSKNNTITNCEIGYIGGSELKGYSNFVRYGNGIEFYGTTDNATIDNCWVYQCYDAGLTCQGTNSIFTDILFSNNLVEYCQYNIELWLGDEALKYDGNNINDNSKFVNSVFEDNILRFAGYNFQYNNRLGSNTSAAACISAYDFCLPSDENTVIRNNVFDTSYRYLVSIIKPNTVNGPKITDNIWITNSYKNDETNVLGNIPTVACVGQTRHNNDRNTLYANDLSTMQESVKTIDLNPKSVVFDGDKYMNCHTASDWTVKVEATNENDGIEIKTCIYCGKEMESRPFKKHGLPYEQYANKNYPLPKGYKVKSAYGLYDKYTNGGNGTICKEEGNFYDTSSLKIVSKQSAFEKVGVSNVYLDGVGFMFWYKTDIRHTVRIRNASNIQIIAELYLDPCSEGRWVTFYYYGKYSNMHFKGDMNSDIRKNIKDTAYNVQFMTSEGNRNIYIDEFYTFEAETTPADSYENDEQAYKFSLKKFVQGSNYKYDYFDDGSVSLSSTYGSSANKNPFSVLYNADAEQFAKTVAKAKEGSGFLQIQVENQGCLNSSGKDAYALATISFNGIEKVIKQYIYGANAKETFLLNVANIEHPENITTINVSISGNEAIKDVKFKFSPITVYYYPEDELILQAEDLNPKTNSSAATITNTSDNNRTYVYNNSKVDFLSFELPELEVGEYDVYAMIYAKKCDTKYHIALNNLRKYADVPFTDLTYSSQYHFSKASLGKIEITKNYSDGPSVLKLCFSPNSTFEIRIDYFSFKKTDKIVEAEPASNFEIKAYPEMKDYETKTILNTFNSYICGSDSRYYLKNQLAGYSGDETAYNLNSRGTLNWAYSDSNAIWSGGSKYLDGDGIRFWFKGSGGTIQFASGNTIKYTYGLGWYSKGTWITIYYKDLVANGDLSNINKILYKTAGNTNANYIDELHTIQQKLGDVTYELNGDGTASVVGYNLRLENVDILSEFQGCPVTTIKSGALSNSLTLRSVNIPDSVTTIEENAFSNNPNLKTVTFGNKLTTIKDNAFSKCVALADVTIPTTVSSLSNSAFVGCTNLFININSDIIKEYCKVNSINYKNYIDGIHYYLEFGVDVNSVKILDYVYDKSIVEIPDVIDDVNVVVVEEGAFEGNSFLTEIILPQTITKIKSRAFKDATLLERVSMKGVVDIGNSAFSGCNSLKNIEFTDSVVKIGDNAFYNCSEIEEFYFGDNITSIGTDAFKNCDFIADLSDNAYVNRDSYSYKYVKSNKYKNYPTTNSEFKYYIINEIATIYGYNGDNKTIIIPEKIDNYIVETIGENAFENNLNVETLMFVGNVRVISSYAFYSCKNLKNITFADSLRKISEYSFVNCKSLSKVYINDVVSVHANAFDALTEIIRENTDFIRDAIDYVDGMTAGWNLGNTMDAHSYDYSYGDITLYQHEHLARWYDYISQDLFDLVAESFNTIRIPITWNAFINPNDDYKIDKAFMDRIQEIVDMCYTAGFKYIIINTHHDSDYYFNVHPSNPDYDNAEYILSRVWQQICDRFEDYDETLIFESMNEIRAQDITTDSDGNGDWYGHDTAYFDKLNSLNKSFYDTVRAAGGNNNRRYLMIQTYGGQKDFHQINKLWLPSVSTDNHIIPSVHWYIESTNAAHYYATLDGITQKFLDKGRPCVIGEIGLARWINDDQREVWVNNAFNLFEQYKIKAIIWEDHGDYSTVDYNGGNYKWKYPKYIETIKAITKKDDLDDAVYNVCIDNEQLAKLKYDQKLTLPVSDKENFIAYTDGEKYYNENEVINIRSDVNLTTLYLGKFSMAYGVAIRLKNSSGLRFYTEVDSQAVATLLNANLTVSFGTIIGVKDRLSDGNLTLETNQYDEGKLVYLTVSYESNEFFRDSTGFSGVVGSIVNIQDQNINREFVGRGYATVTYGDITKTFYANFAEGDINNNSRSIGQVSYDFMMDDYAGLDITDEHKALVDYWANKFLNSLNK